MAEDHELNSDARTASSSAAPAPQRIAPAKPLLPPPGPARLHSYHHPISASYSSSNGFLDRHRPPPPTWNEHRSPPLEHRTSDSGSSFSRILPPLTGPALKSFPLPSLAAELPASASWNGVDTGRDQIYRAAGAGDINETRYSSAYQQLPSLSNHFSNNISRSADTSGVVGSPTSESSSSVGRKSVKAHVPSACLNCKRAHLACDVGRPCRRCVNLGKSDTCIDVQHKKRGRPRLKDRSRSATNPFDNNVESETSTSSSHVRSSSRSSDTSYTSQQLTSSIVRVAGPTHGTAVHPRHASVSVSASSYPFSRPDHLHYPSDRSMLSTGQQHYPYHSATSPDAAVSAVVSVICSTSLHCVRVSEECLSLLGYQSAELVDRSLFDMAHPSDLKELEGIWTSLIDPVGVTAKAVPVTIDRLSSAPAARLMAPATGTIFVQEDIRLRQRSGMFDFYSVRLHLGGGLGIDLYKPETLDRAYIVASLLKLGNDADHPDPSLLRMPHSQERSPYGPFRTPAPYRATSPLKQESSPRWAGIDTRIDHQLTAQRNPHMDRSDQFRATNGHVNSRLVATERDSEQASQTDKARKRSSAEMIDDLDDHDRAVQSSSVVSSHLLGPTPNNFTSKSLMSERSTASSRDAVLC